MRYFGIISLLKRPPPVFTVNGKKIDDKIVRLLGMKLLEIYKP